MKLVVECNYVPDDSGELINVELKHSIFDDSSDGKSTDVLISRTKVTVNRELCATDVYNEVLKKAKEESVNNIKNDVAKFVKEVETRIRNL